MLRVRLLQQNSEDRLGLFINEYFINKEDAMAREEFLKSVFGRK